METVGFICIIVGLLISLVYGIKLLVQAFQTSVLWGLGYLFVPFVSLIFVAMHWELTKSNFLKVLIAIPLLVLGAMLSGGNH